jgi:multidrug transporter EmrE-like cation transporter
MPTHVFLLFLILITVGLNTVAQALLKLGSNQGITNIYFAGGILAYGLSTLFYIIVLGKFNLSVAYPVIIGLTVVSTTVVGAVIFREKITPGHWTGIGLMLSGIAAIALTKTLR